MKRKIISFVLLFFVFGLTFAGCNETINKYDITVQINGAIFGRVSDDVSGTYIEGTELTITATPYEGQTFFCWMHDNKIVSSLAEYTFKVDEKTSGTYIALFECPDLEFFSLESFEFYNGVGDYSATEDIDSNLLSFSISFGYTQNDLINIYTNEEIGTSNSLSVDEGILYSDDQFPYCFDKTRNVYICIKNIYDRAGLQYISETIIILNATNIGTPQENITNFVLNEAGCVSNENLQALGGSNNCSISFTFKPLHSFEFSEENVEE